MKWEEELDFCMKYWNEAQDKIAEKGEANLTYPIINAMTYQVQVQLTMIRSDVTINRAMGVLSEDIIEMIDRRIRGISQIVFLAGFTMAKEGLELEEIPCKQDNSMNYKGHLN